MKQRFHEGDRVWHCGAKLVPAGEYIVERYVGTFNSSQVGEVCDYYHLVGVTNCIVSERNLSDIPPVEDEINGDISIDSLWEVSSS